ncbi:MAG: FAD:protein FMN transferase [Bacteroidales bacterium]|nr:FAD:protein FMN transferase [Bacteroidales bacterium]
MMKRLPIWVLCGLLLGCQPHAYVTLRGYAQGGEYAVKYNPDGCRVSAGQVQSAIDSILTLIDTTLSGYNKNSILSRRNAGEDVPTNRCFDEILAISRACKKLTDGAFDVAAAPLFDIWGFGFTADSLPSPAAIERAMAECREGKKLNFNAIAQGYTCDKIAAYLHSVGVHDMLVDLGEIYCEGLNPNWKEWSIGIDTPEDGNETPGAKISGIWKSDGAPHGIVTSGNYRKFYIRDGRKYAHTIDPRTGYPVTHNLLSATVVAATATRADALATYFMVIGFEEAKKFVESNDGVEACLITDSEIWKSANF